MQWTEIRRLRTGAWDAMDLHAMHEDKRRFPVRTGLRQRALSPAPAPRAKLSPFQKKCPLSPCTTRGVTGFQLWNN